MAVKMNVSAVVDNWSYHFGSMSIDVYVLKYTIRFCHFTVWYTNVAANIFLLHIFNELHPDNNLMDAIYL